MAQECDQLLSARQIREKFGIELSANDFVSRMEPCGNPNIFLPVPEIPAHLMDPDKAEKAKAFLEVCVELASEWGELRSGVKDPRFIEAAKSFEELTGVAVLDIMNEARSRRDEHLGIRR